MRLSPLDPLTNRTRTTTAHAHFFAGRYDEALSWAAMALREWPDYQTALRIAAASNALAGRLEEARNVLERLQKLDPKLREFPISRTSWGRNTDSDRKMSPDIPRACGRRDYPID